MDLLSYEDQKWLNSRIRYEIESESLRTGIKTKNHEAVLNEFLEWFNNLKNIDLSLLTNSNIQDTIDELINTENGRFNHKIVSLGFFHCWPTIFQVDFLRLLYPGYNSDMNIKVIYDNKTDRYTVKSFLPPIMHIHP